MMKVMDTDNGYMVRISGSEYFFVFFNSLQNLVSFIKWSGITNVTVDSDTVGLEDAQEISKLLDETYTFVYDSV